MGKVKVASSNSSVTSPLDLSSRVILARIPLNGPPVISTTSSSPEVFHDWFADNVAFDLVEAD